MGYKVQTIETARQFYIVEGKSPREIAEVMKIPVRCVYNWIKKGEWDKDIRDGSGLALSMEMERQFVGEIRKALDEERLTDPATADALWKIAKMMEKMRPKRVMLSNVFSFMEDAVNYFVNNENDGEWLEKLHKHIPLLADWLRRKYAGDQ